MRDRESDILALMQRAQTLGWSVDLLVRSQHNPDGKLLWSEVEAQESLGVIESRMGAWPGHKLRVVRQELRVKRVCVDQGDNGKIEMSCLVAREIDAPAGEKPVCWRLLTNRDATTLKQVQELIEWYRARYKFK